MSKGIFQKIQDFDANFLRVTGFEQLVIFFRDNKALLIFLSIIASI